MSLIDEIIHQAMERGEFDQLPGQGAPLKLDDERHVPEELRLAHRIMKDNDIVPDWIMSGKELEAEYARLRAALKDASAAQKAALREQVKAYNKRVLTHNLKLPPGIAHKPMLVIDA
jgi:ribosomal protein L39E